jgi:hypothetical protein
MTGPRSAACRRALSALPFQLVGVEREQTRRQAFACGLGELVNQGFQGRSGKSGISTARSITRMVSR